MKFLLCAINSKYIHTNIAVRYLKNYAIQNNNLTANNGYDIQIAEYTINQIFDDILRSIYSHKADVVVFSCYLWNIELVKRLILELKKISPKTIIALGGPEVSYNSNVFLENNNNCDIIMRNEGEEVFSNLAIALKENKPLENVLGITYRQGGIIAYTNDTPLIDMAKLPFVYDDIDKLDNKILYFETSRGCPFSCSYCLSSIDKKVRYMPTSLATKYLQIFLNKKVKQVKFVDRTFNAKRVEANEILEYLVKNDNGVTNFHFEISADILHPTTIDIIKRSRKGLFQFEVGVQSTNEQTLEAICRTADYNLIFEKVKNLTQNVELCHIHMDLIAGLPFEDYNTFKNSYNTVFKQQPNMLQLGFLKVLKGSKMYYDCIKYGIIYQSYAPYEVLQTPWITFEELGKLKRIDTLNDSYLNSGRFTKCLPYVYNKFETPFDFFEKLVEYFEKLNLFEIKWGKYDYYTYLYNFYKENFGEDNNLKWAMRYDIFSREKAKSLPDFLNISLLDSYRKRIESFYTIEENINKYLPNFNGIDMRKIYNSCHIEVFPYASSTDSITAILFDYSTKDFTYNATRHEINIPL